MKVLFTLAVAALVGSGFQLPRSNGHDAPQPLPAKYPFSLTLTGKKKSDRLFLVEFMGEATRQDKNGGRETQGVHSHVVLAEGQGLEAGGLRRVAMDQDGKREVKVLSWGGTIQAVDGKRLRLEVFMQDVLGELADTAGSRSRVIKLQGVELVPLGKKTTIDLGKDENTGMRYKIEVIAQEAPEELEKK